MAISIKTARELALMREAGEIVGEVLDLMRQHVRPGITTAELDRIARGHITARGGKPSFLGYHGFPASICASVNEEIVHGIPSSRALQEGDIISVDVGVIRHGFHGDAALTLPVGEVSDEARRLIETTEGAFQAGIAKAVAGARLGDISAAIQEYAESRGFELVREYVGHGIGREMHEEPQVPNFGVANTGPRLRQGMALAIEPMLTIGSPATQVLNDGWTVVTARGGLAAHYEQTIAITPEGPVLLTAAPDRVV
jgi:methionyl aminopeptidase